MFEHIMGLVCFAFHSSTHSFCFDALVLLLKCHMFFVSFCKTQRDSMELVVPLAKDDLQRYRLSTDWPQPWLAVIQSFVVHPFAPGS